MLRSSEKAKGHAEHLAELEAEAEHLSSAYYTNVNAWTCSCPPYLISWFLLCKHLIHTANTHMTGFNPKHDLGFFASLWWNHFPLFYHLSALHDSLQPINVASAMDKMPVQKILRTLQDVSDIQHIEAVGVHSTKECTVLQSDVAVECSMNETMGKGLEVDGCDNIDQQTHVKSQEDAEHVSHGSSVLTESEDTNNEHQVLWFIFYSFKLLLTQCHRTFSLKPS